ncbi:ribonuclease R [Flaviaesturariibacter aridisoli]|uniref:Ribonuclease R n=1 Tax=Flaviaesturariibacter aridisoli TaxID=2545761 RepID=A0A4R4DX72_9BACT|nr:ribonuclease R [Flaviaesturariibacter aridisoli]TCZ69326.1 ribonuclease R [Flaviaesturariibacter aridisoli]
MGRKNTKKQKTGAPKEGNNPKRGQRDGQRGSRPGGGSRTHSESDTYTGKLEVTRSGMGFVVVEGLDVDILVRPNDFNSALHGDKVRVAANPGHEGRRMQGTVVGVVERKQNEFIGTLHMNKGFAFVVSDSEKKTPDIFVPEAHFNGAVDGDRVVARIKDWATGSGKRPIGEVVSVLSPEDRNDIAMKEILLENGFGLAFSDEVLEETARIPDVISEEEIAKRRDFRQILTFTIDPVDAKDFDDALSIRVLKNGNYEIGVHIADVGHYVAPDTALDTEAYQKATSVYLPDRVSPMLPEHISNVLCSLRPHEDKLTFSAVFEMTPKAQVKGYWLGKTVIHSDHRFTYEDVQEVIEKQQGHYEDELMLLNNMAQRLRKKRIENGAINFSSQEVRFKLDEKGKPIGIVVKESKEAHQLIEEFMLLANRYVAEHVSKIEVKKKPVPFAYRVHDLPSEEKMLPFMAFARKFGHKFDMSSPEKIAESFNKMLADVKGKPEQHVLETLGIRTMAKATYTTENVGHYGLGFDNYCHFTSPIRRYPDILVHRVLLSILQNDIEIDKKMDEKCKHCSERERAAMESERAGNKYKQVEYMLDFLGEEFDGVVSGVSAFGFWVETVEHKCEGMVPVTSLADYDEFRLVQEDYSLVGARSGKKFRMGDKVRIKVVAGSLEKRTLDYDWVLTPGDEEEAETRRAEKKGGSTKSARKRKKKGEEDEDF